MNAKTKNNLNEREDKFKIGDQVICKRDILLYGYDKVINKYPIAKNKTGQIINKTISGKYPNYYFLYYVKFDDMNVLDNPWWYREEDLTQDTENHISGGERIKMKILCVCSYGQVRSVTMKNTIQKQYPKLAEQVDAKGVFNHLPEYWEQTLPKYDQIIICNPNSYNEKFMTKHNYPKEKQSKLWEIFYEYNHKTSIFDEVGNDKWGVPNHPEIIKLCEKWLENTKIGLEVLKKLGYEDDKK